MKKPPMTNEVYLKRMTAILNAHYQHGGRIKQVWPETGLPRFILIETENGFIAELGPDLLTRTFNLAWKVPASLHGLLLGLMQLSLLPLEEYSGQNGHALLEMAKAGASAPPRFIAASLALEGLVQNLGGDIARMLKEPIGATRRNAAKQIKKRLCDAVDAIDQQSQAKLHASKTKIVVPTGDGKNAEMAMAEAAIEEARQFVESEHKEPTKAELRLKLQTRYAAEIKGTIAGDPFWTKVWNDSGLEGLQEDTHFRASRKSS